MDARVAIVTAANYGIGAEILVNHATGWRPDSSAPAWLTGARGVWEGRQFGLVVRGRFWPPQDRPANHREPAQAGPTEEQIEDTNRDDPSRPVAYHRCENGRQHVHQQCEHHPAHEAHAVQAVQDARDIGREALAVHMEIFEVVVLNPCSGMRVLLDRG